SGILNILWRRRMMILALTLVGFIAGIGYGIVTKPLYRATAQIRPGITGFTINGGPFRSNMIKDVVRWYNTGLYGPELKKIMGLPEDEYRPDIAANFIPKAIGIQGGDIITLTTLSETPEGAENTLNSSIQAFINFTLADTIGNSMLLSLSGLEVKIAQEENKKLGLKLQAKEYELEIAAAEQEISETEIEEERFALKVKRNAALNELNKSGIDVLSMDISAVNKLIGEMDGLKSGTGDSELLGSVLTSSLEAQSGVKTSTLLADTLRYHSKLAEINAEDLVLRKQLELEKKKNDAQRQIDMLKLKLEMELDNKEKTIEQSIKSYKNQIKMLSPLERVGPTSTTHKPVRPRKSRATTLLTLAAFFSSVVLAFVLEYFNKHKDEILASK
ncbi:hypothetical protein HN843_01205, partial [bacterium]|nr:hypothetical protein [bacterium]